MWGEDGTWSFAERYKVKMGDFSVYAQHQDVLSLEVLGAQQLFWWLRLHCCTAGCWRLGSDKLCPCED